MKFNTLFSGIGGSDIGLELAGFTPGRAFEIDENIAAIGQHNLKTDYRVADLTHIEFDRADGCDVLAASPVCKSFSVANASGEELESDKSAARAVARAIEAWTPSAFILENVWGYRNSESFRIICEALADFHYGIGYWHLNSANYGVAQTRKRLICIAIRGRGCKFAPPETHSCETPLTLFADREKWVGWYETVADLLPSLPTAELANWQLERLEKVKAPGVSWITDIVQSKRAPVARDADQPALTVPARHRQSGAPVAVLISDQKSGDKGYLSMRCETEPSQTILANAGSYRRAVLISSQNSSSDNPIRRQDQPSLTVVAGPHKAMPKAILIDGQQTAPGPKGSGREGGTLLTRDSDSPAFAVAASVHKGLPVSLEPSRIVQMSPRCLARFQSFPDSFELVGNRRQNCIGIGNACPPLLMKAIAEHIKTLL